VKEKRINEFKGVILIAAGLIILAALLSLTSMTSGGTVLIPISLHII